MKAMVVTRYGPPPEVIKIQNVEKPVPKAKETLIKVYSTTVTSGDLPRQSGRPFINRLFFGLTKPKKKMRVLGSEIAGKIEAVGRDVKRFKRVVQSLLLQIGI